MSDFVFQSPRPGTVVLMGELTLAGARELQSLLLRELTAHAELEVDLLNITVIDTAGIQLLLLLHREAMKRQKALSWLGQSMAVDEALAMLGLSHVLGAPAAVVWS